MAAVFIRVIVIFSALPRLFRCHVERSGFQSQQKSESPQDRRNQRRRSEGNLCRGVWKRVTGLETPTCDSDSAFSCRISIFVSRFQVVMVQQQIYPRFPARLPQTWAGILPGLVVRC